MKRHGSDAIMLHQSVGVCMMFLMPFMMHPLSPESGGSVGVVELEDGTMVGFDVYNDWALAALEQILCL